MNDYEERRHKVQGEAMKNEHNLTLVQMARLHWTCGALTAYIVNNSAIDGATRKQAKKAAACLRRLYAPLFRRWTSNRDSEVKR